MNQLKVLNLKEYILKSAKSLSRIMDITRAQQKALEDDLVAPANHALKLTSFYKAFEITADVPEIYMQEFWVTASRHHSSLRFKMNGKSHTVNVDNFRDMLQICPKLLGQKFEDPPFEEEILSFIRDLGHTGEIKVLSNVNVNHMHQPWRSFAAIINKCLSGKTTALESLRLSRAQILWGMYHNKNVDYVYLLWEDLVYQVENKNSKKNSNNHVIIHDSTKSHYRKRHCKVIQSIPRRNKMFWHTARDDHMFTTIRVISKHQDTQIYGAILPQHLTNQAMLESKAYKTYHAYATGEKIPKPKYVKNKAYPKSSPKKKSAQASEGKRLKTSAKVTKPAKKNQLATMSKAKGLNVLSKKSNDEDDDDDQNDDNADTEDDDDQNDDNADTEDDDDQNDDNADNEGDDDQDDDNEQTESNNDDDDFVHPKLSTFNEKERQDEEDKEEEWSDDEAYDEETQGVNVEGEELNEEETNKEDESSSVSSGFISNMLNPNPDTSIDSILNLNTKSTSLDSHAVAAYLSELELKKILIDKMENNKSIDRSIQQKTLYKALVDAYETDKDILETYGDTVMFKRRRDDEDEDEEPSAGSNRRSTGKSAQAEEPIHADEDLEEPAHQEFDTGFTEDQPVDETTQHPDWFQKPTKPPTPDRDWNKTLPAKHGPVQP
ncbi:hypothetical protein Tco_1504975 [Tanacetum coccineum]